MHILLISLGEGEVESQAVTLQSYGFSVRTCPDEEGARQALEEGGDIDLLILDLAAASRTGDGAAALRLKEKCDLPLLALIPGDAEPPLELLKQLEPYAVLRREETQLLPFTAERAITAFRSARRLELEKESCRLIYEHETDAVIMIDEEHQSILEVNRAAARLYGYDREELIGRRVWELSAEPEKTRRAIAQIRSDMPIQITRTHLRRNGERFPVRITGTRTRFRGAPINIATIRDISEERRMEREIREREREYADVINTVPSAIIKYDNENRIFFFNRRAENLFGYSASEVMGKKATVTTNPKIDSEGFDHEQMFAKLLEDPEYYAYHENENRCRDGSRIWMAWRNTSIYDTEGRRLGMLSVGNDISEYKRNQERLAAIRSRFQTIFNEAPIGILTCDSNGKLLTANPFFCNWLGYTLEELTGKTVEQISHPEDYRGEPEEIRRMQRGEQEVVKREKRYLRKDGSAVWGYMVTRIANWPGEERTFGIGMVIDISQRIKIDQERLRLLEEKDLLLQEVHHRIKNDMHIVSSLLSLQSSRSTAENEVAALAEAENRIRLMRSIYDKLYMGTDFRSMEGSAFIYDLLEELRQGYSLETPVHLEQEIDELEIPVRLSFPLGLIINELVTNAFKYAFRGQPVGTIRVSVQRNDRSTPPCIEARVEDDGTGLPPEVAEKRQLGFGLTIVDAMVSQYHGEWEVETDTGTLNRISLPIPEE